MRANLNKLLFVGNILILMVAIILANLRALLFVPLYPEASNLADPAWIGIALWFLIAILAIMQIRLENLWGVFIFSWRKNWALIIFMLLFLSSIFWSSDFSASLFRVLEMFFTTLIGSYIGVRYSSKDMLRVLFWFGACLLIVSAAIILVFPNVGRMVLMPYNDAWRGIYWHKNHLGIIVALISIVFLIRAIQAFKEKCMEGWLDILFYVFSLVFVYFADSAGGYFVLIFLHLALILVLIWLKLRPLLRTVHYYAILLLCVVGALMMLANLGIVLDLFHRSLTLTGRTDLWEYLLHYMIPQRLWFGYGYSGLWSSAQFDIAVKDQIGWGYPVVIADNGFLDILLHLGLVGLISLSTVLVITVVRSVKFGLDRRTLPDFFSLLLVLYAFVANISYSLFFQTGTFIWLWIIAVLFLSTRLKFPAPLN